MVRSFFLLLLVSLILLLAVLLVNTFRFTAPPAAVVGHRPATAFPDSALAHFQQALRFQTVSYADSTQRDTAQFLGFHRYLRRTYPVLHRTLGRETVGRYSLLYRWAGRNPRLPPAVFMAHLDVVPVEADTRPSWRYAPFAGTIAQGQIWGRGATDNKANLTALLESIEQAITQGHRPERTVYLVFGHDEETGGWAGAHRVAELLHARGIVPAYVLDEGGYITTQRVPGMVGKPVGLIGTAEKGYLSLELAATVAGGHSSIPETVTALGLVSDALTVLHGHSFPAALTPAMQEFGDRVGPHLPFVQRLAFANRWLFTPLILKTYLKSAGGAAAVHTTMVPTIFQSGVKDNVVPTSARATVNLRLLPGVSVSGALAQVRAWLPDAQVKVSAVGHVAEPSGRAAATDALGYRSIEQTLNQQVPGVVATPFLFVAQSDSRHFAPYTANVYKFSPMTDPVGLHGVDEHLSLVSFRQCVGFYQGLLREL